MKEFELKRNGESLGVVLGGDLTASMVPELKSALQKATGEGVLEVDFDLSNTAFIDSTGIGLLIATYNSLSKKNGTVRVVMVSEDIYGLLRSMRLEKRLCVVRR